MCVIMDQSLNSMFADKNSMEFAKQNIDTSGKLMLQVGYVFRSVNCPYVIQNKKDNNRQQTVDFFQFHSNNVSNKKKTVRGYKRGSS